MIVPKFWAEGRIQDRTGGKQVTVRRFGWSDSSQADAQASADQRAREALERIRRGEKLPRREPKLPYNGADGVPIREEIVSQHGETVITRNIYGARCLNTPNVLFADVDYETEMSGRLWMLANIPFLIAAIGAGIYLKSFGVGLVCFFLAFILSYQTVARGSRLYRRVRGGPEKLARSRLAAFLRKRPDWHVRLYRTPAGLRLLVMNRTFKTDEPIVAEFFKALGTDPTYIRMCLKQQCFRARVSPKPWRIGISQHMRPRPGVWPVNPERRPERTRWIEAYENAARSYAACAFIEAMRQGAIHASAQSVQKIHDELSRATSSLKIA
jgi:hypothetical protein